RPISWLLLVLLHQRTGPAVSKSSIPARLQHGTKIVVLVVASHLAFPVEFLFSRGVQPSVQARGPRGQDAIAGTVLGRLRHGLLYAFNDTGILLASDLSGSRIAAGLSDGLRFCVDQARFDRAGSCLHDPRCRHWRNSLEDVGTAGAGRYLRGAHAASRTLHAIVGTHGRSHDEFVRILAVSIVPRRYRRAFGRS